MANSDVAPDRRKSADIPPTVVMAAPSRGIVGTALQIVVLLLLLSILGAVVLVLFAVASLVNVPGQVAGGVGSQLGGVTSQAGRALSNAERAIQSATDPNHPPVGLIYDNEFTALSVWHVGDGLPGGTQYVLTLQGVKRRQGAESPEAAVYAVIHSELRQPRETRILGQLVRTDSDPHDHVVYKGETFRIGRALYRVNWVSEVENAVAAGVLRHPDSVTSPLKFEYE